jgi:tetratricopeptide (TPR) repeat protein
MLNCWFRRTLFLGLSSLLSLATASSGQSLNCLGTTASDNPAARDEIDQGVESYKSARYAEAISHFEKATSLAPCLTMARSYLATAQAQNVVPGLSTPDNLRIAEQSIANFHIVLTQDPHDINSLKQVAGIYFSIKKLDDAREWQKKVLAENPADWEASYTIGVIDWTQAHQHAIAALSAAGLMDDGEGNIKAPPEVLESIKQQNSALVEEALQYLTRAIQEHPKYDDAMAYLNLVYRRKADIDFDNPSLRDEDVAKARGWGQMAMSTRKQNELEKASQPNQSQP